MLSLYKKFENILFQVERVIVTLMMATMFVTVFLQVVTRFFNLRIPDTTDISLVAFAVMTFIGAGLLVYTKGHITIEVSTLIKSKKIVFVFELLTHISLLVIIAVILNMGYSLLAFSIDSREATMALRIPMAIPFSALVIGLVLMLIHTIGNIFELFSNRKSVVAE
ncbi:TRAP transporter small permease [Anaerobacillus isosaccharinicus]|uniref:TRAP transporter small permease n=1 Tax=Anaerobacillus isosaccharinicus TaxID=1532552 RepID=A0A1S2M6Y6_9BACI|nr:TRAP transporter small permease [Anaerobacillus isosaccharinicus]MBA5585021.1 TRAP transporter small permease [Anaerobacillus isosaccharinicus]QOY36627.1 TRAP transporter small permease [Anaerobacillus isosaccharinicus]